MNYLAYINILACFCISIWAAWRVCSKHVRCNAYCRILFGVVSLSAAGVILSPHEAEYSAGRTAEVTLNVALALLCLRHVMLKNRLSVQRFVRRLSNQ